MSDPTNDHRTPVEPYYADFPEQESPLDHADDAPEEDLRRPRKLKKAAIAGARVVTGVLGIVVAAGTIAAATFLPLPNVESSAPSAVITPIATDQQLVCPGALLRLSDASGAGASTASALGAAGITAGASPGSVGATPFAATEAGTGGTAAAPHVLTAPAPATADEPTPLVSGAQAEVAAAGGVTGLTASACVVATGDTWLVGGATTTGRTTLVTLSNPSEVAATVDLEIFGEQGAVTSPGLGGITVQPGSQNVLSLAGFAPQLVSPVVHVTSRGGLVVANLQQTITRGIESGGSEVVDASAAPRTLNVIPGMFISNTATVGSRLGEDGFEDLATVLRMYVPGDTDTTAEVSVLSEDGTTPGTNFTIDVAAGVVTQVPIEELVDGKYTVTVRTDQPAVAGVRLSNAAPAEAGGLTDFAWLSGAAELTTDTLLSTPASVVNDLHLYNSGDADTVMTITPVVDGVDGVPASVTVLAGTAATVPLSSTSSYRLSGFTSLHASVSSFLGSGIAGYAVVPPAESSADIRIFP
ncbi:MAG TPA: DUF5719 family protein [Glaciihabitans sp.]|jgi:hypothetical protein|nr:DUF5719 family protein [Glaciihabitans sp.]